LRSAILRIPPVRLEQLGKNWGRVHALLSARFTQQVFGLKDRSGTMILMTEYERAHAVSK